jgi:shikimate kinase
MGAGKSTVGRKLAARFGLRFIDLDHEIERATGASVNLIFEIEGEPNFRDREEKLLDAASRNSGVLLATGGGAVLRRENRERLKERGFVVYLETNVDTQLERLKRDRARPLLRTPDPRAKLLELAKHRNELYRQTADLTWISGQNTARSAAESLVYTLRNRWQQLVEVQYGHA